MELIYKGKTKDVYKQADGNYLLQFKDDVTGANGVFDPGANAVGAKIEGNGRNCLRLTKYFFEALAAKGIKTHYVASDLDTATMTVVPCKPFGKGLEVILRYKAVGSFFRRYGDYCTEGQDLPGLVEMTFKDDARNDPLVTKDTLVILGVLSNKEYDILVDMTQKISAIIRDKLAEAGLELYDIKFEYGRNEKGELLLMDEISAGNMRCFKDGKWLQPNDVVKTVLG
ncbi:MAG: phosphoribosylaminoimidazolesuccinocarboxamide synthase [Lentisphaerae bacterium]|jgi:phosphoribosylaminoimidazole-succinocarboxamide synthase|nr:phosphoribosylaminoimidazolesuccinocarboxamide synthase [Lentisphaerota bacterium]